MGDHLYVDSIEVTYSKEVDVKHEHEPQPNDLKVVDDHEDLVNRLSNSLHSCGSIENTSFTDRNANIDATKKVSLGDNESSTKHDKEVGSENKRDSSDHDSTTGIENPSAPSKTVPSTKAFTEIKVEINGMPTSIHNKNILKLKLWDIPLAFDRISSSQNAYTVYFHPSTDGDKCLKKFLHNYGSYKFNSTDENGRTESLDLGDGRMMGYVNGSLLTEKLNSIQHHPKESFCVEFSKKGRGRDAISIPKITTSVFIDLGPFKLSNLNQAAMEGMLSNADFFVCVEGKEDKVLKAKVECDSGDPDGYYRLYFHNSTGGKNAMKVFFQAAQNMTLDSRWPGLYGHEVVHLEEKLKMYINGTEWVHDSKIPDIRLKFASKTYIFLANLSNINFEDSIQQSLWDVPDQNFAIYTYDMGYVVSGPNHTRPFLKKWFNRSKKQGIPYIGEKASGHSFEMKKVSRLHVMHWCKIELPVDLTNEPELPDSQNNAVYPAHNEVLPNFLSGDMNTLNTSSSMLTDGNTSSAPKRQQGVDENLDAEPHKKRKGSNQEPVTSENFTQITSTETLLSENHEKTPVLSQN